MGGLGDFLLGYLPLWGREGVTIINTEENKTISGYNRSSTEQNKRKNKRKNFKRGTRSGYCQGIFCSCSDPRMQ
jgi:hypothetical protein